MSASSQHDDVGFVDVSTDTYPSDTEQDEGVDVANDAVLDPEHTLPTEFVWGLCADGYRGECTKALMPLNWDDPAHGAQVAIHLSRRKGTRDKRRAIWLLQGGPGGSVRDLAALVDALEQLAPEYTVYTIEHRGVGASGHLTCPQYEAAASEEGLQISDAEWPACRAWVEEMYGDQLPWLTPTQSARDLLHAVRVTRTPQERVLAMGISYGTYWAHRALQLDGAAFDGVILDSIIPPGADYGDFERHANEVGIAFLEMCAEDAVCRSRLGGDPQEFLRSLLDRLDQGHCAETELDANTLKSFISSVLMGDQGLRSLIPPLLHRLDRCNTSDREAIAALSTNIFPPESDSDPSSFSLVLQNHVVLSELWSDPPQSHDALQERVDENLFAFGAAPNIAISYDAWPRYPRPVFADSIAQTQIPLLMLVGELDPRAPQRWGDRLGDAFTEAHQHYIVIPGATHGVMFQSAVNTPLQLPCGLQLALAFMNEPTEPLDTACLRDLQPVRFAPSVGVSQRFLETEDPWGTP